MEERLSAPVRDFNIWLLQTFTEENSRNIPEVLRLLFARTLIMLKELIQAFVIIHSDAFFANRKYRDEHQIRVKERHRTRVVVMEHIGAVEIRCDKYEDPDGCFMYPNRFLSFQPGERIQENVKLNCLHSVTQMSYRKTAASEDGGENFVSYGTVKNVVHNRRPPELAVPLEKRDVPELFVFMDEAHASLQGEEKEDGTRRAGQQVPLITICEGRERVCEGRYRLIHAHSVVDESCDVTATLEKAEAYILEHYDLDALERVWVIGDGAKWIQTGFDESFVTVLHSMDAYHRFKAITPVDRAFPKSRVREKTNECLERNDFAGFEQLMNKLEARAKDQKKLRKIRKMRTYFTNNWQSMVCSMQKDTPKSCTEGMVYHVLAKRITLAPMAWSHAGLGHMAEWCAFAQNGGDIRSTQKNARSAGSMLSSFERMMDAPTDWSVFEPQGTAFDLNSGTLHAIQNIAGGGQLMDRILS